MQMKWSVITLLSFILLFLVMGSTEEMCRVLKPYFNWTVLFSHFSPASKPVSAAK